MTDRTDMVHVSTITPMISDSPQTLQSAQSAVTAEIGPRAEGVIYYDADRLVQVREVITDRSETQRILRRNAARFAIRLVDMHAGTEYYTGAVWTGSDRVLKAVA